jgi:hypothetical protein
MARRPDVIRPVKLTTTIPEDVRTRLDIHLYSDLEGRVPQGAYQTFFVDRIREFFDWQTFDLSEIFPELPEGQYRVKGPFETINLLRSRLNDHA